MFAYFAQWNAQCQRLFNPFEPHKREHKHKHEHSLHLSYCQNVDYHSKHVHTSTRNHSLLSYLRMLLTPSSSSSSKPAPTH